jgi:hypothetical protein
MQMKKTGETLIIPVFNCELVTQIHTACNIATPRGQNLTSTKLVHVPYICNVKDVVGGEELIVRHVARAKTKKVENKRTWRDEAKREEAGQKKQQQQKKP